MFLVMLDTYTIGNQVNTSESQNNKGGQAEKYKNTNKLGEPGLEAVTTHRLQ